MQFVISFIVTLICSISLVIVGWRKRPETRPEKVTGYGWATLVLGLLGIILLWPAAMISIVATGCGLLTGAVALIRRDTHVWTIVGQSILLVPVLFWISFMVGELLFVH